MDFPQQIEEILTEKPAQFDVTMDPILDEKSKYDDAVLTAIVNQHLNNHANDLKNSVMTSSIASILDDTTPSDSGVQLLDSESSEIMIESITSQNGFDFDDKTTSAPSSQLPDLVLPAGEQSPKPVIMTKSDFENSNVIDQKQPDVTTNATEDIMTTSNCSTFDTENIVYRRRVKKQHTVSKQPKKRVSFHEDILKNTRTDNIHIEHGFITYKNGRKSGVIAGRYSWCSEGDGEEFHHHPVDDQGRQVVYRNACSDVLDYGNAEIYENSEGTYLQYDNSGVFEYQPQQEKLKKNANNGQLLYKCSCSSSNSSLDSGEEGDKNSNRNYGQAKSSSCDCIGVNNNNNNNFIGENCYFSEPNIDNLNDANARKSVWSKEKKPKTSCLKKTKRHTDIIQEHDLSTKVKKFNVHDMNNIIDNSKMIFGSLKSIFTIPLPERGVPEGSEDIQSVYECIPENETDKTSPVKQRPFLSKSLDGGLKCDPQANKKKFIHNVDEQLRRKNEEDLYAPTRQNSDDEKTVEIEKTDKPEVPEIVSDMSQFRNKFIINCESTVFEHTGVSYSYDAAEGDEVESIGLGEKATPIADTPQMSTAFISAPIKQTFANIFKTLKETAISPTVKKDEEQAFFGKKQTNGQQTALYNKTPTDQKSFNDFINSREVLNAKSKTPSNIMTSSIDQSICSDVTSSTTTTTNNCDLSETSWQKVYTNVNKSSPSKSITKNTLQPHQNRHLPSPMKRRTSTLTTSRFDRSARMSPDLFNMFGSGRESKSTILSEEFDDILTITTDADKNESDIVIVDYPDPNADKSDASSNLLKPPKSSLINRFLRNVTQKKIIESSIRKNNFFAEKMKNEQKLFAGNLYLKGVKPKNQELIEDLNAEIAMEIEMSGINSPRRELVGAEAGMTGDVSRFELGIGEISIDIFNGNCLHILKEESEILMKVFKLYTGYSREGHMTPVLVFLTDRTLYVTDLVRNRLCNKFVLPYSELDVILMGPYGNTVLLSNGSRDMQQVLLAGGPYPADGLVANLELCARRSGSILPAVGQLTLEHLAPLQSFVRENSSVSRRDVWIYYAVVNMPAGTLGNEQEPLGPHVKGFLMHRRVQENSFGKETWHAGYFLLKAGVLYMFNDSSQKLPTWAMALAECQGARRAVKTGRPHCFEILLKHEMLQLAAPDEYVASEWLQALVQSASGLFEMQEKHKTLGCTLVMTENHLITLREDFRGPLRRVNKTPGDRASMGTISPFKENFDPNILDTNSAISSVVSTPTRNTYRSNSSMTSTPTKISQMSRSTTTTTNTGAQYLVENEKSYTSMSSFYGKNAGVEVLTCAAIKEMIAIRIPSHNDSWWCILEFSCQEVRENSDDLVIFFASSSEMQRFLRMLEQLWQAKNNDLFPVTILDEDDILSEQCTDLYMDINRSWEPLLSAALGYPQ